MFKSDIELLKVYLQWFSCAGDGMHLEICRADASGQHESGNPYPIITIRADCDDDLKFVVYSDAGIISIPLEEIERAIACAKEGVHSEDFYD